MKWDELLFSVSFYGREVGILVSAVLLNPLPPLLDDCVLLHQRIVS